MALQRFGGWGKAQGRLTTEVEAPPPKCKQLIYNGLAGGQLLVGKDDAKAPFSTEFLLPMQRTDLTEYRVFLILRCLSGIS